MQIKDTLLLLVDNSAKRSRLRNIFQDNYNILESENRTQLKLLLEHNHACIASIIVKAPPPKEKSSSIIYLLDQAGLLHDIPVILLLDREEADRELAAYEAGATDVIIEPCDDKVVFKRIKNVVDLSVYKDNLEALVEKQSKNLREANDNMVDALSAIIEYRSAESGRHVLRVRHYVKVLLSDMAASFPEYGITEEMIDKISGASSLHDIGKISIPDSILNKPDRLTDEEFNLMKHHTTNGARMIENLVGIADEEYLRYAYNICLYHHERWDGKGYPAGLKGDEIPLCAQVTSIADVYDVLTTERVYKAPYQHNVAINMILNGECGEFSPKLLESFKNIRNILIELAQKLSDDSNLKSEDITDALLDSVTAEKNNTSGGNVYDAYLSMPKSGQYLTSQTLQAKYQALIHYLNATIIEVDLKNDSYHIVYNPQTDFKFPPSRSSFSEALHEAVATIVHPDDRGFEDSFYYECEREFHQRGARRFGWETRVYQPAFKAYFPWRTTVVKIDSDNPSRDDVLVIIAPVKEQIILHHDNQTSLQRRATMYDIAGSVICYKNDREFTMVDGIRNLYNLLGYTADEVKALFGNKLINLIVPEDRENAKAQFSKQLEEGNIIRLNHRMFCKDGSVMWVIEKAKLVVEKYGTEYIYSTLNDNSLNMKALEKLHLEAETNKLIIDQSDDIVFEWNIETNTINYSPKWEQRFGFRPNFESYSKQVIEAPHIHPDDIPVLKAYLDSSIKGRPHHEFELRISNKDGQYLWNRVKATTVKDSEGTPVKVVGVISDIDTGKRTTQYLKKQAEEDGLTKLLNRDAATVRIKDLLEKQDTDEISAMLLIDLDNFKAVNDLHGHLYGDSVLEKTADEIRKMFRTQDIVSRVGGDEFLVFIDNLQDISRLAKRAEELISSISSMFADIISDSEELSLSCSIGIALAPDNGTTFLELYEKADKALYKAKEHGKGQYFFYA